MPHETENSGVACPRCGCRHLKGRDSKRRANATFRYRYCRHCGALVRTKEVIVQVLDRKVDPETGRSLPADDSIGQFTENELPDICDAVPILKIRA